ncbi:MAG: Ig-like domain repeat protein [Dehalococcoidia bacterium]|nr:Ig-like domain repeat protein [Dehalococcoidia bacterium]
MQSKVSAAEPDVFPMVAGGYDHSLALKSDGTVWAWGRNNYGQLGDGTTTNRSLPVQVSGLTDVIAIAGGNYHSIALKSDGTVWAWGRNDLGQLGDGSTTDHYTPVQVSGLTNVIAIASGYDHSLALKSDSTVWTWGRNSAGQLGDGTFTNRSNPVQVSGLYGVLSIAGGGAHSIALKNDGTVWAWGRNNYGQLGDGTTTDRETPMQVSGLTGVIAIASGYVHSLALKSDSTVWTWGYNFFGQLGDGTTTNRSNPVQVSGLYSVLSIAGGDTHSLALKNDGTVWAWGSNGSGQLGDGAGANRSNPVQVMASPGVVLTGVIAIDAGGSHFLALKNDGTVWACGSNNYGLLGDSTTARRSRPVQVLILTNIAEISTGYTHSLVLKNDGTVWAWGQNNLGQLGDGTTTNRSNPVQVMASPGVVLTGVIAIDAGSYYSLALRSDGTVWAWGWNSSGKLGNGTTENSLYPVMVSGLTDVIAISAGGHSLAIKSDKTVWSWGNNSEGQLGDGTTTDRYTPVQVSGLSNITAIAASGRFSLALRGDGTVWAWGRNAERQLGDGTNIQREMPVQVSGLSNVSAISVGAWHSLALLSNGTVKSWGTGTATGHRGIDGFTDAIAIEGAGNTSFALKSDGTVWACGVDGYGKFGNGTTTGSDTPMQASLTDVVAIAAYSHMLALKSDGTLWACGQNSYGQVGDGTNTNRSLPVQVTFNLGSMPDKYTPSLDLTVSPAGSPSYPIGEITLTATLSGAARNNAGKTITFTGTGIAPNTTVTTNAAGVAIVTIAAPNAGDYTFVASFDGDAYNESASDSISYTVNKGNPTYTVPTGLTAVYGDTLDDVVLPTGWSWDEALTTPVGNVGTQTHPATFTPADTANYNTVSDISVSITIAKATPTYTVPTGLTATYGNALSSVTLSTGWSWDEALTTPVGNAGTQTHPATFTPADTANYNTVSGISVSITVNKANPTYTVPTGLTATYGDRLSSVTLPTGWAWTEPGSNSVGPVGTIRHPALFTPADTANYNTAIRVLNIEVSNANPAYTVPTGLTAVYGATLSGVTLPTGWSWDEALTTPVGNVGTQAHPATFTPNDTTNYNTVSGISVSIVVGKAEPTITIPAGLTAAYGATLSGVTIPSGWTWDEPDTTSVGNVGTQTHLATFTPADIANYYTVPGVSLSIAVGKAAPVITTTPTASNIYKGQALSVSAISGGTANVAGSFAWATPTMTPSTSGNFNVVFNPTDSTNYLSLTISVSVNVLDKDALETLITQVNNTKNSAVVGVGDGQYTQASVDALSAAIAAAQSVADTAATSNTQNAINNAYNALNSALSGFSAAVIAVDFSGLDNAISDAKGIEKGKYTDDTWDALQEAIAKAETLQRTKANVTQAEADDTAQAIADATAALKTKANMTWLWICLAVVAVLAIGGAVFLVARKKRNA